MENKGILLLVFILATNYTFSQYQRQYFDGKDTASYNSFKVSITQNASNIWQIGKPQKNVFDSSATKPNAIVTDTIHSYPVNNISRFTIKIGKSMGQIIAIRWLQKLDMDSAADGGVVEFSSDNGSTWQNIFFKPGIQNPNVYNVFGYDNTNVDSIANDQIGFTGTDSTWKDVWLCFEGSWLSTIDTLLVRYSFISDAIDNNKEGWIIDNMNIQKTVLHPVKEAVQNTYLHIYPNPSEGIVNVNLKQIDGFHIIESMQLIDMNGKVSKEWNNCPTRFWFDTQNIEKGQYYLKVKSNIKSVMTPLIIK